MLALQDLEENILMLIEKKEALIYKSIFWKPPNSTGLKPRIKIKIAYKDNIKNQISYVLIAQSIRKALHYIKINIQIFYMV